MKRMIAWFATNRVAANLLMGFAVIAGLVALTRIPVKMYPDIEIPIISVTVPYPGAAPEEVASGVCARIEERVEGITGVKQVNSIANEGLCNTQVELYFDSDNARVLDEVENQVNSIETFPEEAERPIVSLVELTIVVIEIAVTGPTDERALKELGERVRDDIRALPGITHVNLANVRPYEISVEVSQESLLRNGLTLDEVAAALRMRSLNLPGGSIKSGRDDVLLRTRGEAHWGHEIEKLVVTTRADGTRVLVGDIARVVDGFEDSGQQLLFDGMPASMVQVARIGNQDLRHVSESVRRFVEQSASRYPDGVQLTLWNDESVLVTDRLGALVDSAVSGLLLVLILLTLFLRPQLAIWVAAGIPIAFLGALFLIYSFGFSIDAISMVGFILALGMVVDDAVVVGEGVHVAHRGGSGLLSGAIEGAQHVLFPVTFGVLTTIVAFAPLLFSVGPVGEIMAITAVTVIFSLVFSLVECQMVLPAHLGHAGERMPLGEFGMTLLVTLVIAAFAVSPDTRTAIALSFAFATLVYAGHRNGMLGRLGSHFARLQLRFESGLESFLDTHFRKFVRRTLRARILTLAIALVALASAAAILIGGHLPFTFMLPIQGDRVAARLTMPLGVGSDVTREAVAKLAESGRRTQRQLADDSGASPVIHIMEATGGHLSTGGASQIARQTSGSHLGEVILQLTPSEDREATTNEIAKIWRDANGGIDEALELKFETERVATSADIEIRLSDKDMHALGEVAARIRTALHGYPGVYDISDSIRTGKKELQLAVTPTGEALGVTLSDLARQVRQAFYGEETQRIQRGREDVRIMVRLTELERQSLDTLYALRIRTPTGGAVPFQTVAEIHDTRGFASISRTGGKPFVDVTANVDPMLTSATAVLSNLIKGSLADIVDNHPGMSYTLLSEQRRTEVTERLGPLFLLALFVIFSLLAIPLRSYTQPLIIMSMLPFAFMGAIWGHLAMKAFGGIPGLSMPSIFGMVAASGVVVNATLVLMHEVNHRLAAGDSMHDALVNATGSRARPILITTVTTFAGLLPLMLSRSVQAQPLIPLAASLAYGVLFASLSALLVAPSLCLVMHDIGTGVKRVGNLTRKLVRSAPRLTRWMEQFPYVQESLRADEFADLQISDDMGLDPETARIAREGLVRLYYHREFDRQKMDEQLAALAARAPATDDMVTELKIWAEKQAFQLSVHMLQGVMAPSEAARPLSDILDACLSTVLAAAERDLLDEPGENPNGRFALVALDSAGRREFAIGHKLTLLFLYATEESTSSDQLKVAVAWYGELLQRFMRLVLKLSPADMLFEAPPLIVSPDMTSAPYMPQSMLPGEHNPAACSFRDLQAILDNSPAPAMLRMLSHARVIRSLGGLRQEFEDLRKSALSRKHDLNALIDNIGAARNQVSLEHHTNDNWDVWGRPGGLADLNFVAEYLRLTGSTIDSDLSGTNGLLEIFDTVAKQGQIKESDAALLTHAARLWQCLDGYCRITCIGAFIPESLSEELRETIARVCGADTFQALPALLDEAAAHVEQQLNHLMTEPG